MLKLQEERAKTIVGKRKWKIGGYKTEYQSPQKETKESGGQGRNKGKNYFVQ